VAIDEGGEWAEWLAKRLASNHGRVNRGFEVSEPEKSQSETRVVSKALRLRV
jgi:hypothetical protein